MISVIIPTHNKASILKTTLQRLVKQSYAELEIIVIDDGCSDETSEIVQKFNYNIKYLQHHKQQGTISARKTGLKHATGSLIAFLDDDDLWNNNKIATQKKIFDLHPQLDFVMCNYKVNDQIKNLSYSVSLNDYVKNFQIEILKKPGPFLQCCLFKSEFIKRHSLLFDYRAFPSEDWDWFIEISKINPSVYNVNNVLFEWNFNQHSQSANVKNEARAIAYIIDKHEKIILKNTAKQGLSLQYRRIAGLYKEVNDMKLMKQYYEKAFCCYPFSIKNIWHKLQSII